MNLLVIHEKDHEDNEETVIGIAEDMKLANKIVEEYYGKVNYKQISFNDIRDSGLECSKVLEIQDPDKNYKVTITFEWFILNKV